MQHAVLGAIELAGEVDLAVCQQCSDDGERLGESTDTAIERQPEGAVLALVPARTEAEDQPPARDAVNGRRLLGQHRRFVKPCRSNERAEQHPFGRGREGGKRRPYFPRPTWADGEVVQQVITEPHRVKSHLLGGLRHADELREGNLPFDLGQLYSDEQRSRHGSRLYMRQIGNDRMENR